MTDYIRAPASSVYHEVGGPDDPRTLCGLLIVDSDLRSQRPHRAWPSARLCEVCEKTLKQEHTMKTPSYAKMKKDELIERLRMLEQEIQELPERLEWTGYADEVADTLREAVGDLIQVTRIHHYAVDVDAPDLDLEELEVRLEQVMVDEMSINPDDIAIRVREVV